MDGGANVLRMDSNNGAQDAPEDPFADLLVNSQSHGGDVFEPVMVDARVLSAMNRDEV